MITEKLYLILAAHFIFMDEPYHLNFRGKGK